MGGKGKGSKSDEATRTLVGARPIKMLETEREKQAAESSKPATTSVPEAEPTPIPLKVSEQEDEVFSPKPPRSVEATGLTQSFLETLCLKHLFHAGELRGGEISRRTCLPPVVIEEVMERLRAGQLVDIKGTRGVGIARTQTIFSLTEAGKGQAELALERDRYVGPAPVSYSEYCSAVAAQTIRGNSLTRSELEPHLDDLVLSKDVYDAVGPALNSGRSLFVYGPPGNGKTALCQRLTRCLGGTVYVPYAVLVDDLLIKVFDEAVHISDSVEDDDELWDERWVRCERPMVTVGGDLTLEDLELRFSPELRYYEAPFQLKANGGVLLIDDFGRQQVRPSALLNRWIVPLENEVDYLAAHTGKKVRVPFDVFVIFSTNLDPAGLVDDAFLRRVRYKIEVGRPSAQQYREIFDQECAKRKIRVQQQAIDHLVRQHYQSAKRPFNACEPRDLLDQVSDVCTYRRIEPMVSMEIIDQVVANYFVKLDGR